MYGGCSRWTFAPGAHGGYARVLFRLAVARHRRSAHRAAAWQERCAPSHTFSPPHIELLISQRPPEMRPHVIYIYNALFLQLLLPARCVISRTE
jgi:hypothetical protein